MNILMMGLGNMGLPMAQNLIRAGHRLWVQDLNPAPVAQLQAAGAQAWDATSMPEDLAAVVTMLPAAPHVRSVYLDSPTGPSLLSRLPAGAVCVDCSTIDPATAQEVAAAAQAHGLAFADAPVSGGTGGASAGTLTFMVGTDPATFERLQPVLSAMGRNIVHCGGVGMGQVAKICNNLLLGISMAGVAEAMSLGQRLGIDERVLAGIINTSTGRCWSSEVYNPVPGICENAPASRDYSGGFGVGLMRKDLGLAVQAASDVQHELPMGQQAWSRYDQALQQGLGALDFSAVIRLYSTK